MAQCIIEITDREGLSDLIPMADVLTAPRERAIKGKKSRRDSVYPRSFVWNAHRVGPGWVASFCVALACGVMAYFLASPSHRALDQLQPSLQGTEAAQSVPTKDEAKPALATMREETRTSVLPVVLNPGAGDSRENDQRKKTAPAVTRSRAIGPQHVRRGEDDAPDGMPPPRHQPTAGRSYMDLRRNFTLNR
jgi:uncharacterized iron-regulated membrane protein